MSKTYPLKLPASIKAAARLAKEDGVSLNHWIAAAVAQKVGAVETAAEFYRGRVRPGPRTCTPSWRWRRIARPTLATNCQGLDRIFRPRRDQHRPAGRRRLGSKIRHVTVARC